MSLGGEEPSAKIAREGKKPFLRVDRNALSDLKLLYERKKKKDDVSTALYGRFCRVRKLLSMDIDTDGNGELKFDGRLIVASDDVGKVRDVVMKTHHQDGGCCGRDTTHHLVEEKYTGISRDDVEGVIRRCSACAAFNSRTAVSIKASGIIETTEPWSHVQCDLIDLHSYGDTNEGWCYLLTMVDLWSRFCIVRKLRSRGCECHMVGIH